MTRGREHEHADDISKHAGAFCPRCGRPYRQLLEQGGLHGEFVDLALMLDLIQPALEFTRFRVDLVVTITATTPSAVLLLLAGVTLAARNPNPAKQVVKECVE